MSEQPKIVTQMIRIDQNWDKSQKKPRMYVGYLPASALINEFVFTVSGWKSGRMVSGPPTSDEGYQRAPAPIRRKQIARYVETPYTILPTSILISARGFSLEPKYLKQAEEADPGTARRYVLSIDVDKFGRDHRLFIIDGQHRVAGLRYAIEDEGHDELGKMELPVVLIDECNYFEEVMQFVVINKEARRVPSQLALQCATQLRHDESRYSWLLKEAVQWQDRANEIVRWLEDSPTSPWFRRIILPNTPTGKDNRGLPKLRSFVDSLKDLLISDGTRPRLESENVKRFLVAYWGAISDLCVESFNSPNDYVLQKTNGIFSLHSIARNVMSNVNSLFGYNSHHDKEKVKQLLGRMEAMKSSFWLGKAPEGETDDDWAGEAGKYGGMKGFGQLAELLQSQLTTATDQLHEEQRKRK